MVCSSLIKSQSGNTYLYSDVCRHFIYIPSEMESYFHHGEDNTAIDYFGRKHRFLQEHHLLDKEIMEFSVNFPDKLIRQNLACLRQLLIEVTDSCNLRCKYCGYGEFYNNYDQRETKNQKFGNVKILIDYLVELWKSEYNISQDNIVMIGFYGGEPLVNMKLIKEIITYVECLDLPHIRFGYNMTTNAVLLDKYMDFLIEKDFKLLFSLDGNSQGSGYRVDKQGKPSFEKVVKNISQLKAKYPVFFETNVNFNSVLHNLNTIEETYEFIKEKFGKTPRIAELNSNGIIPERREEFFKMFHSKVENFKRMASEKQLKDENKHESTDAMNYHSMLANHTGNRYKEYIDLFDPQNVSRYIPTGTCQPFERKIFLTVNGKILPCERIGQEHVIARVEDGKLKLDLEEVDKYYKKLYQKVLPNCIHCHHKRTCGQCLFLLEEKNGKLVCPSMSSEAQLKKELSEFVTYAEEYPDYYETLLSENVVD